MKIRSKIQLIFGATIVVALVLLVLISAQSSYQTDIKIVNTNMTSSANLAAGEISKILKEYMAITTVTGSDSILAGEYADTIKTTRIESLAETYGFTSGDLINLYGVGIKEGTDYSSEDFFINRDSGETVITPVEYDEETGTYGFLFVAPLTGYTGKDYGMILFRLDIDYMLNILNTITISDNSDAFLVDSEGNIIVHDEKDLIMVGNIASEESSTADQADKILGDNSGYTKYASKSDVMLAGYAPIDVNGWHIIIEAPQSDFTDGIIGSIRMQIIIAAVLLAIALLVAMLFANYISNPIVEVSDNLKLLSEGDLTKDIKASDRKDEIGILINSAYTLQDEFKDIISESNRILGSIADYNLNIKDMKEYKGSFNDLAWSINRIKNLLYQIIKGVKDAASAVEVGSDELSRAAAALSEGTLAQATSVEGAAEKIDTIASGMANNLESETKVGIKLRDLNKLIATSNEQMTHLLKSVTEIEEMSSDIQKISSTIESIAFQTNILALNASVEAARAGENGKGFAVVADEVGNLARKSSDSAAQTSELIEKCISAIEDSMKSVNQTFENLKSVVANSDEISTAFEEIEGDTRVQSDKSNEVKNEITVISDVVQTNTATAEETAAASETLKEEAAKLNSMIKRFQM